MCSSDLERFVEERLGTPPTVAAGLVAGAVAMVAADRTPARRTDPDVVDGAALGVAQALALIPGVSRSGATRSAARARGFGRREAAELSRAVALPVLAGAAALKGARLIAHRPPAATVRALAAGTVAAGCGRDAAERRNARWWRRRPTAAGWGSGGAARAAGPSALWPAAVL